MTETASTEPGIDVVIVGGGPAGLSAAIELKRLGTPRVVVLERDSEAGGMPRHTAHTGFGLRDLHRLMSGPTYAARLRAKAEAAGVEVKIATTATGWSGPTSLTVADPDGCHTIAAAAVLLATGVRERPRSARLVPGDRPAGIFTTGSLQRLTNLHHERPGRRAVIVGAEHVSFSAILTLEHAGCDAVALVTRLPHHQTYRSLRIGAATRHRVKVLTSCDIAEIHGHDRVEAVTLTTGRRIECDTVVFTGDWIPDHELARRGDVAIDRAHLGPLVDAGLRTDRPGVFAAGNLLHPAETADVCALDGRHSAAAIMEWLAVREWTRGTVPVEVEAPLRWITPALVTPLAQPPRHRFELRVDSFVDTRSIEVAQGDHVLWHGNVMGRSLVPNRSISISAEWVGHVDTEGPAVTVRVHD